jgi:hypothetical protein
MKDAGLATSLLNEKLRSVDLREFLLRKRTQRTYPALFPVLHLDHIYYAENRCRRRRDCCGRGCRWSPRSPADRRRHPDG